MFSIIFEKKQTHVDQKLNETKLPSFLRNEVTAIWRELSILRISHCHWHYKWGGQMLQKISSVKFRKFTRIWEQVITFTQWFAYTVRGCYFLNICSPARLGTISIQMGRSQHCKSLESFVSTNACKNSYKSRSIRWTW